MPIFELKTKIYFGRGEKDKLLQYLSNYNFTKCGVVIDKALLSYDIFKDLITELERGLEYSKILIYDFDKEPTYSYLDTVKTFFKKDEIECLIGIGGGSVIDTTKGLAVLIKNPVERSVELRGFPEISNLPVPVVAIPTIAGTGTEVTYYAVFNNEFEKRKFGINTEYNFPVFALLDPELTLTAPLKQSLSTALDCIVHSLESFMSKKATFISRPLSIEGFYHAFIGTNRLLKDPKDVEARESLMKGSYMAGISLMNSSGGIAGALSSPLGTFFNVPHGFAGAFFLQHIVDYNLSKGYTDFYLLYDRVNSQNSIPRREKAKKMVEGIREIIEKSGVSKRLSTYEVNKENIFLIFKQFIDYQKGAFEVNPVKMSDEGLNNFLIRIL